VEAIVDAFADLPSERLVIVGRGPLEQRLKSIAPDNVQVLGMMREPELRWLYAHCQALVAASYEDFGLTPVEAMAFGKPSVALRYGGFLETVIEGETGVFFDQPTGPAIARAVGQLQRMHYAPELLAKRAEEYSHTRFEERLHAAVASAAAQNGVGLPDPFDHTTSD
jgi:glycosyltransferase involved in cell wall biosynthesis